MVEGVEAVVFATRVRRRWLRSWAGVGLGRVDDVGNLVRAMGEGAGVSGVNIVCVGWEQVVSGVEDVGSRRWRRRGDVGWR